MSGQDMRERSHDFDAIKARVSIVEVIGKVVPLKSKGGLYEGCCPFHHEKTPSFKVYADHYHCFGCGAHGDAVDFVAETQNCTISEAIERLGAGDFKMDAPTRKAISDREAQRAQDRQMAIAKARQDWAAAVEAPAAHPYLVRKGIRPHFARYDPRPGRECLLIPVYDRQGEIQSVQSIDADGGKMFQKDAPMSGGRANFGIAVGTSWICEGFATGASIYESIPDRVCVAFSKDGVKAMAREFAEAGIPFAIASDRNAIADMLAIGAELQVPVFAPPEPYDDFNDLAKAEGHDAVGAILRGAPLENKLAPAPTAPAAPERPTQSVQAASDDPIDVWAKPQPPALPPGLLPPLLERFAVARARMIGCDPGGIAMAALTVCSAVITDRIKVKVKRNENWTESARLWTMLIGDPSYKKSPIMRAAASRVSAMDAQMLRDFDKAIAQWQRDTKDGIEREQPRETRLRIEDITMEAAQEVCRNSPDGILALQDELAGWFGGIEKYSGGKGGAKDRSFWLRAFNGGEYAVNRISRKSTLIDNLSISILGGIQPDAIRRIMHDSVDDGLIQRFLPVVLAPADLGVDEEMPDVAREYDELVERLHALAPPSNFFGDVPLRFTEEAMKVREDLHRKYHAMVRSMELVNKKVAAHFGKYEGIFPRLCIIWHCIENINADALPETISEDTTTRAAAFMDQYIRRHANAFYGGVIGLSEDHDTIQDVAGYILAHRVETVTMRTLQRGSRAMRKLTRQEGATIFEQLEAMGWLEQANKRSDAPAWKVNSRVHELFEAKANEERERRQEAKAAIADMIGAGDE